VANAMIALLTNEWITGTIWSINRGMMAWSNMPNWPKPPAPKEPVDISHDAILEQPQIMITDDLQLRLVKVYWK
jgi:hypothetical protein